jgi:hypothetical protein
VFVLVVFPLISIFLCVSLVFLPFLVVCQQTTRIWKLTETQQTNTNYKLHSITTCNKGNKSSEADSFRNKKWNITHTWRWPCSPKHVVWTSTTKRKINYNKAARRRQLNLKTYWTIQCNRKLKYNISENSMTMGDWSISPYESSSAFFFPWFYVLCNVTFTGRKHETKRSIEKKAYHIIPWLRFVANSLLCIPPTGVFECLFWLRLYLLIRTSFM